MEKSSSHTTFERSDGTGIVWYRSFRFRMILIGILIAAYDMIFLFLYISSSRTYMTQVQKILEVQDQFQDQFPAVTDALLDLGQYLETGAPEDRQSVQEQLQTVTDLQDMFARETPGPYGRGFIAMLDQYGDQVRSTLAKVRGGDVSGGNAGYTEASEMNRLINLYVEYVRMELTQDAKDKTSVLYQTMQRRLYTLIVIFIVLTLALGLLIGVSMRRLLGPISGLTRLVRNTSIETWTIQDPPSVRMDETGILTRAFYDMLNQNRRQYDQLLEKQRVETRLERAQTNLYRTRLEVFQSQINSHFLFNCLNLVSRLAYMEHAPKTRSASTLIASFLRSVLNQFVRTVTLKEEFERLEQYTQIQQLRFGDRIEVEFDLDPDLEMVKVPSMVLQPLLENAYGHGAAAKERGFIRCAAESEDETITVYVWDDGGTLTDEKAQELKRSLQEIKLQAESGQEDSQEAQTAQENGRRGSIGLKNVYQRLLLMFPGKVVPVIESEEGSYTKIGFRFFD